MNSKRLAALFLFSMLSTALAAQERFTMQRIIIKGARHYSEANILAYMGLKVGGAYTQDDLQNSASKLNSLGIFRQVGYRFSAATAEYDLVENTEMLPVRFDNFAWMSDDELTAKVKQKVPLFSGSVPQEGNFAEEVSHAIEVILGELGAKDAKVQYMGLNEKGAYTSMNYTVLEPHVLVGSVEFKDATPDITQGLQEAVKKNIGDDYTRTIVSGMVESKLLPVLRKNGYLRGYFGPPTVKLVSQPGDAEAKVAVAVPVSGGAQYKIATLTMKGDDAIAKDAAKQLSEFKTGQVANMPEFRTQLSRLGSAYISKGYMNAKVKAEPTFDDTAHTVSYEVELLPGDLYKLTKLDMQGLDETQKTKVAKIWTLHEGDTFDGTYAQTFLKKNEAKLEFLNGYQIAWKQKVNDDTKTVELYVLFRKIAMQGN